MTDLAAFTELLGECFEIGMPDLAAEAVSDPYLSVRVDMDVLRSGSTLSPAFRVSGFAYVVDTGLIRVGVPLAPQAPSPST